MASPTAPRAPATSGRRAGWSTGRGPSRRASMRWTARAVWSGRCPAAAVWPRLPLDALADRLGAVQAVVGVDSGLSHIAVALERPHVQLYNWPTSWRTGPQPAHGHRHQLSVEGRPAPTLEAVWAAWQQVVAAAGVDRKSCRRCCCAACGAAGASRCTGASWPSAGAAGRRPTRSDGSGCMRSRSARRGPATSRPGCPGTAPVRCAASWPGTGPWSAC
ncbi:glycosyltransferase family 9 protein [Piscinibacter sakaiensis]|uniref:glycosyltransferase family 9 protein n=1 Tax=Piscinibacter sakaiensis TaxID=1547922 RepID=UPI00372CA819